MCTYEHRVRYHEADAQGFLFNARYLELADVAMTEFFRSIGWGYADLVATGMDPSVVSATLTFRRPARFEDVLQLSVTCPKVGRSSFHLDVDVSRNDESIARIEMVYVNVDPHDAVARPLVADVAAALREHLPPSAE